jgi:hypothetical protein
MPSYYDSIIGDAQISEKRVMVMKLESLLETKFARMSVSDELEFLLRIVDQSPEVENPEGG